MAPWAIQAFHKDGQTSALTVMLTNFPLMFALQGEEQSKLCLFPSLAQKGYIPIPTFCSNQEQGPSCHLGLSNFLAGLLLYGCDLILCLFADRLNCLLMW